MKHIKKANHIVSMQLIGHGTGVKRSVENFEKGIGRKFSELFNFNFSRQNFVSSQFGGIEGSNSKVTE
jgi:hypothetical protein